MARLLLALVQRLGEACVDSTSSLRPGRCPPATVKFAISPACRAQNGNAGVDQAQVMITKVGGFF